MKRFVLQIIGILLACCLSSFFAPISIAVLPAAALAFSPEKSFNLVAPLACTKGTLDSQEYHASYGRPGQSDRGVYCVSADGTRTDVTLLADSYLVALSYLACFVPLCIPLGLIGLFAPLFLARSTKKKNPPSVIGPA
jgi:hypothetical protein